MQHLFTQANLYGLDRQKRLQGEQHRELVSLSDGRPPTAREMFHQANEWLFDQLAELGRSVPCVDNELACDARFIT